jgi:hypothetical protein
MFKKYVTAVLTIGAALSMTAQADNLIRVNAEQRTELLKRAEVWIQPQWYTNDLTFIDPQYNYYETLASSDKEKAISGPRLLCFYDEKLQRDSKRSSTGKTEKLYCYIAEPDQYKNNSVVSLKPKLKADGSMTDVKIKYQRRKGSNKEIYAELATTRLMSSLGFAADKNFFVKEVYCQNCSEDPWSDTKALEGIRLFSSNITEAKYKGTKIENAADYGWIPSELKNNLSADADTAKTQSAHRDALLLLSAVIQHSDNKASNHRLLCTAKPDASGACPADAKVVAMIQDVGATLGDGKKEMGYISDSAKMNLRGWAGTRVWKDAANCIANQHATRTQNDDGLFPTISEAGRQHLAKLLTAFASGPNGRARLEKIFAEAQVQELKTNASAWADALNKKIEAINNPLCEVDAQQCGQPFRGCPQ